LVAGLAKDGQSVSSALVLFSGGQDSATCLVWALEKFDRVETIGFDYGQRHKVELECRYRFMSGIGYQGPDRVINLSVLGEISDTALTSKKVIEMESNGLPSTFVPGRNLMFFTLAAAVAYRRDLTALVGGMCETDYSGYPDCRDDTLKSLQTTINMGLGSQMTIETPLMWMDKAATWKMADDLGGSALIELIKTETHTCYLGDRDNQHDWGYGCGACPACRLRRDGFGIFTAQ
jgi:7-cyano-7-deazaguanine synthase